MMRFIAVFEAAKYRYRFLNGGGINGNRLESWRLNKSIEQRLEKPVPAAWLRTGEYTHVVLQPDKVFTGDDGEKFGFSLYRAGFVE